MTDEPRKARGMGRDRAITLALGMSAIILTGVAAFLIYDHLYTEGEPRVKVTGDGHEVDTSAVWTMYRANAMHDGLAPEGTKIPTKLEANWKSAELNFEDYSASKSSPAVDTDRVFIGAGNDGFYCFALEPNPDGSPNLLWHLEGSDFPDCECSPGLRTVSGEPP